MYVIMYIEVMIMQNTNITTARAELFKLASSCIKYNNVININTKEGNVIMISIHSNALGYGNEWYPNANYWTVWTTVGKTNSDILATYLWESCK